MTLKPLARTARRGKLCFDHVLRRHIEGEGAIPHATWVRIAGDPKSAPDFRYLCAPCAGEWMSAADRRKRVR